MITDKPLGRSSFRMKVGVSLVLAGLADVFLYSLNPGATVGAFALVWIAGVVLVRPGLWRDARARAALFLAAGLALVMIEQPGLVAWILFGGALSVAVLSARVATREPSWRWGQRLVVQVVIVLAGPLLDLRRVMRLKGRGHRTRILGVILLLALPVLGGAVFLALFASANPLIADALDRIRLPRIDGARLTFWLVMIVTVGAVLRPRWRGKLIALPAPREQAVPGITAASIILSLVVFNALFALQNGLDLAFLWSGAALPHGTTLADYAHRGAYPLIATALLAGLFVLVFLRPGSDTAARPLVRGLVVLWVAQNMLLVASSLLRTADYIEAYSLTRFRIAALIWMVLVAVGLLLICARMLFNRSAHWLIDANVRVTLAVLVAVSVVDLGSVSAAWNVRHAREVDGTGAELDLCYLNTLGASSAVSLVELEQRLPASEFKSRVGWLRSVQQQRVWDEAVLSWNWRAARRLKRIQVLTGETILPDTSDLPIWPAGERSCDGTLTPLPTPVMPQPMTDPTPAATSPAPPLTSAPGA